VCGAYPLVGVDRHQPDRALCVGRVAGDFPGESGAEHVDPPEPRLGLCERGLHLPHEGAERAAVTYADSAGTR
jgi:hypothetical protein